VAAGPFFRGLLCCRCSLVRCCRSSYPGGAGNGLGAATPFPCPSPSRALFPGTTLSPDCGVVAPALPFRCTRWLRVRQLGGPVALFFCGLTSSFLLCFAECFVHTASVLCYAFLLVTCLPRQSPVWPWPGAGEFIRGLGNSRHLLHASVL
jgi:hypothetical protein